MFRRDPQNTGFIRLRPKARRPAKPWQFQASSHVWGYQPGLAVWSSPALGLVDGDPVVLVGSYDNNVYCLDATDGTKRWRFTTGAGVYSTPALWHAPDGAERVFAASSDRTVYALDAGTGRRVWTHTIEAWRPTMGGARLASPCVGRAGDVDAVFVAHWVWDKSLGGHLQAGGLTAIDARTGTRIWLAALGDNQLSSPIYVETPDGPRVFVASENGNLYALEARDGRVAWSSTDRNAIKASPAYFAPAPGQGRVLLGSKFGFVRCLDARSGAEVWRFKTTHWVDGSAAIAQLGPRAVAFVGSYDTQLYALEAATGSPIWAYRTAGGIYSSPALALDRNRLTVLVGAWDHHLHAVSSEDGSMLWSAYTGRPIWDSISLGDSIWSSPSVADLDGQLVAYVGSYGGPFYAMPLAEAAAQALARPGSNINFWVGLPLVLALIGALTLLLTRRQRRLHS